MLALQQNIAIQGELVGPKVNANRLRLQDYQFRVFNIWDIENLNYLPWAQVEAICEKLDITTVPVIYHGPARDLQLSLGYSVSAFLQLSEEQKYTAQAAAEGIVVKTDDDDENDDDGARHRRVSFKVISNKYLLKHKI